MQGIRRSSQELNVAHVDKFKGVFELFQAIDRARKVARFFDLSPTLPIDFDGIASIDIHNLYLLITKGQYRIPGAVFTLTAAMTNTRGLTEHSSTGSCLELGSIAVDYRIYDTSIRLEDVDICLTNAVVDEIEVDSATNSSKVTFRSDDGEWVFSKSFDAIP